MFLLRSFFKYSRNAFKVSAPITQHLQLTESKQIHYNGLALSFINAYKLIPNEIHEIKNSRTLKRKKHAVQSQRIQALRVNAYATAEEYKLEKFKEFIRKDKTYKIQNLPEDASNVLHIEYSPELTSIQPNSIKNIFIFREGSIVFWNFQRDEKIQVLNMIRAFQNGSYDQRLILEQMETLDYTFTEDTTKMVEGDILLKVPTLNDLQPQPLELYAFSNAIALSVKLAIWEASLDIYASSIEFLLEDLKNGRRLRISESEVLKKTGELFTLSHLINLSSDLMDTPDFYWNRDHLEKLYHCTHIFLNVPRRTKVMNGKLRQCVEFMELLRDYLKDKHHTRLELMIIFLILVEVIYGSFHFYDRYYSKPIPFQINEE